MGRKGNQHYSGQTYRPKDHTSPALSDTTTTLLQNQTVSPHEELELPQPYVELFDSQDPRTHSAQSLVPRQSVEQNDKRTLLLVYIHGFMGDETSFQGFPAHVHNILTVKLADSYVLHTKIYPRYKSRNHIDFARDAFGEWLRPHENPDTDVILLGHSMGGMVSAEIAFLENHRILGTVNFDTPFLGMHPGVIASGLGSLFRPAPCSPAPKSTEAEVGDRKISNITFKSTGQPSDSLPGADAVSHIAQNEFNSPATVSKLSLSSLDVPGKDPNYDPPFSNDVRIPQRSFWANTLHFIQKHSDGLTKATQTYVESHLEFGGAMADYNGLKSRYERARALEDGKTPDGRPASRVRFVNLYTVTNGRPKKPKKTDPNLSASRTQANDVKEETRAAEDAVSLHSPEIRPANCPSNGHGLSGKQIFLERVDNTDTSESASALIEDQMEEEDAQLEYSQTTHDRGPDTLADMVPVSVSDDDLPDSSTATASSSLDVPPVCTSSVPPPDVRAPNLPPLPLAPEEPPPFDANLYKDKDKDTRKLAEKEHARLVRSYKQATKDHNKAVTDRRKFLEKREKNAAKEREKLMQAEAKEQMKREQRAVQKEDLDRSKREKAETKQQEKKKVRAEKEASKKAAKENKLAKTTSNQPTETKTKKPPRTKKFCLLPPKINGEIDPCWVRVFMPGVDEVGAHCGLFIDDGERYRSFVDDVVGKIGVWVAEREGVGR